MLKRAFLILCKMLYALLLNAQLHPLIQDDFNDNYNKWPIGIWKDHSVKIENSKLVISKNAAQGKVIALSRYVDEAKDFVLEATFIQTQEGDNKGVGLVWGHSPVTSHDNYFAYTNDGYFIVQTDDKGRNEVGRWKKTDFIKGIGKENTLRIEQRNERLTFYINKYIVKEIKRLPWLDYSIGVITFANAKIIVDKFSLRTEEKINLSKNNIGSFTKENLGPAINSVYEDIGPIVSADGRTLYFSRKQCPENIGGINDREDLWFAHSEDGIVWGESKNMGKPINSKEVDNLSAISADNNTLMFAVGNGDYAFQHRTNRGWSQRTPLGLDISNEANHREAWLAADGNAILFTAKLKGNLYYNKNVLERDIFVCIKKRNGEWSKPINLGATINTKREESSPFLAADGRTLYFATDGRPGFGDQDIFVSKRIGEGWTEWTEPINLGPEINSPDFDAYYTVPASGNYAYMVSNDKSLGKSDIIRVTLTPSVKPDPVVLVFGKTIHAKTKKPLTANISMEDLETQQPCGEAISNPLTGEYKIVLPYGKNYGFHAFAKGYLSVNENMSLAEIKTYEEIERDLYLIPIVVGETLPLNNVFFVQGKAVLKAESFPELDRLVQILKDNPSMQIELSGHTDNVGNAASLVALSHVRVNTVKNYLINKGIASNRLTGKGYGAAKPLVKNDTEEHRKTNRRVEFKITRAQ